MFLGLWIRAQVGSEPDIEILARCVVGSEPDIEILTRCVGGGHCIVSFNLNSNSLGNF